MIDNKICLDKNYSTTRVVTQEKPEIINNPEDKFETLLFLPDGENRKGEGGLRTKGYFKKSFENKPLISIITVVYNGEKYLEETIQSVINQTYDNVEYIIIDGGSKDGTIEIIKKYEDKIDYWVSEKDGGIYDAMNKGIKLVSEFSNINLLNAGDVLFDNNTLGKVSNFINNFKDDIIYGNTAIGENLNNYVVWEAKINEMSNYMSINHQSIFIPQKIHKQHALYSSKYKIAADYDKMNQLIYQNKIKFVNSNIIISFFIDDEGASQKYRYLLEKETMMIRSKYKHKTILILMIIHFIRYIKFKLRGLIQK